MRLVTQHMTLVGRVDNYENTIKIKRSKRMNDDYGQAEYDKEQERDAEIDYQAEMNAQGEAEAQAHAEEEEARWRDEMMDKFLKEHPMMPNDLVPDAFDKWVSNLESK